jgi:MFS family permease
MRKRLKRLKLPTNVWAVTLTSFLTDISSEMLFNLVPFFLFNVLGVRTSLIGLIEGIAESTSSLLKVFSGWLSDRLQSRKRLAVLGYGLSTLSKPFLYLANSWVWVLAVRFSDRVGKGLRTAPRDALVADSVEEGRRGLAFGLHRAGDTAGAVVGLAAALVILRSSQGEAAVLTRGAFQIVVLASFIPALLAVLVLALWAQEVPGQVAERITRQSFTGLGRPFLVFLAAMTIFTLGNSSDAFLMLRAQNAGLSLTGVMGMLITFNLIYTLVSGPAGALSDQLGRRRILVAGWLFYGLVYLGFALAASGWQTWALMGAYGLYYGLTEGVARAFVADLVPAARRGTAYGAYNAVVGFFAFPASLIAGLLWQGVGDWQGFGPAAPFLLGALLAGIGTVVLLFVPEGTSADPIAG